MAADTTPTSPEEIAKLLRDVRESTGLTLREFEEATGFKAKTWSAYENGGRKNGVPSAMLQKILDLDESVRGRLRRDLLKRVEEVLAERKAANQSSDEPAEPPARSKVYRHRFENELVVKIKNHRLAVPAAGGLAIAILIGAWIGLHFRDTVSEPPTSATAPVAQPKHNPEPTFQPRPPDASTSLRPTSAAPVPSPTRTAPAAPVEPQKTAPAPVAQPSVPPQPTELKRGCQWEVVRSSARVFENPDSSERSLKEKESGDEVGPYCTTWRNPRDGITYLAVTTKAAADKIGWMNKTTLVRIS
ncbi:helix-turn-helix domain-containing protein [Actinomadura spongiicola]|nr:helix-turn-helix domain-containing protein [Actinomadura spongiicola]